jgi:hypothetical protein
MYMTLILVNSINHIGISTTQHEIILITKIIIIYVTGYS